MLRLMGRNMQDRFLCNMQRHHILLFSGNGTEKEILAIFLRYFLSGEDGALNYTFQNTQQGFVKQLFLYHFSVQINNMMTNHNSGKVTIRGQDHVFCVGSSEGLA